MYTIKKKKKPVPDKGGNNKLVSPLEKNKKHQEYHEAMKTHEEVLADGDVRPKSKQMTQQSVTGALTHCTQYDRKTKRWMGITDAVK